MLHLQLYLRISINSIQKYTKTQARERSSLSGKSCFLWFHPNGVCVWLLTRWSGCGSNLGVLKAGDICQTETNSLLEGETETIESGASLHKVPPCYLFWARLSSLGKMLTWSMFAVTELFLWRTLAIGLTLRSSCLAGLTACWFWTGEMTGSCSLESPHLGQALTGKVKAA